jgi:uncharacterized membrane protein YhaH (DUF805 family)
MKNYLYWWLLHFLLLFVNGVYIILTCSHNSIEFSIAAFAFYSLVISWMLTDKHIGIRRKKK